MSDRIIHWIGTAIIPHEGDVRRWLKRDARIAADVDDIIQESYSRIARGAKPTEVHNGRAYFFRVVKNLLIERARREKLVRIETMAEIDALFVIDEEPLPDRRIQDREELAFITALLQCLPARTRDILMMRRVEGLSQRETAARLGVSENVVEKQTAAALSKLLAAIRVDAEKHGFEPRECKVREPKRNTR